MLGFPHSCMRPRSLHPALVARLGLDVAFVEDFYPLIQGLQWLVLEKPPEVHDWLCSAGSVIIRSLSDNP